MIFLCVSVKINFQIHVQNVGMVSKSLYSMMMSIIIMIAGGFFLSFMQVTPVYYNTLIIGKLVKVKSTAPGKR